MIDFNILKIASDTKYYGLKNIYSHQTRVKNKICGDLIKIELQVKKNKIDLMRYETESCIFCQASASILAKKIKMFPITNLKHDIQNLSELIKDGEKKIPPKYKAFKELFNSKNLRRFDCIMLPFNALIVALRL